MSKARNQQHKKARAIQAGKAAEQHSVQRPLQRKESVDEPDVLKWLSFILLALCFAFIPALGNDFVNWDDYAYITENGIIQSLSWENIKHIFTPTTYVVGNYHPLTVLTLCVEYALVQFKPFLYHFDNIVLHAANTLLVFFVTSKLFGKSLPALFVAALFAIHPLRVESVAWAAERKDVLYTFFFLISLYLYQLYTLGNKHRWKWYMLSILAFLLSILSKGQAVVLPLTFILVDYLKQRTFDKKAILEKVPFFLLSLVFGIIAMKAQHTSLTTERLGSHGFFERIMFASYGFVMYLYKFILPVALSCFYSYPVKTGNAYPVIVYLAPLLVLVLLGWIYWRYRTNRQVMFGTLFFIGTISIVIQLLPVGDAVMADRYTYIPLLGVFFIVGYLMETLLKKYTAKQKMICYLFGGYIILLSCISFARTLEWKNNITLWSATIKRYPNTAVAYNNRGVTLLNHGSLDSAYNDLIRAVALKPEYFEAYSNLGNYYSRIGKYDVEMEQYNVALKYNATHANSLFNRGLCFVKLKQYDLALRDYHTLIQLEPDNYRAYYSMGIALRTMGGHDQEAIDAYTKAIAINHKYDDAYNNRANIFYNLQQYDRAIEDYNYAINSNPNNANAFFNRSAAYFGKHEWQSAMNDALKAQQVGYKVDERYFDAIKTNLQAQK